MRPIGTLTTLSQHEVFCKSIRIVFNDLTPHLQAILLFALAVIMASDGKLIVHYAQPKKPQVEYVHVPVYVKKPVYIEKPVYVDKPVYIPVHVDKHDKYAPKHDAKYYVCVAHECYELHK